MSQVAQSEEQRAHTQRTTVTESQISRNLIFDFPPYCQQFTVQHTVGSATYYKVRILGKSAVLDQGRVFYTTHRLENEQRHMVKL